MAPCASQTFGNITPEKWQALQTKAAENHIDLNGDSGETTQNKFTFTWQYDASSATLTIQCLNHPWWANCGEVNGKVHNLVEG
jgi:type VI protein secretion system component Hcp